MSGALREELAPGHGGWCRYQSDELDFPVFIRYAIADGRLVVADIFVPAPSRGLTSTDLRRIDLGRIESWVNADHRLAPEIRRSSGEPGPDLRTAAAYFDTTFGPATKRTWVVDMILCQYATSDIPRPASKQLRTPIVAALPKVKATLCRPNSKPYGDAFYRQVATVYVELMKRERAPAGALADANDVPVSTAHRWVKEARRRGFLDPGVPGKAG